MPRDARGDPPAASAIRPASWASLHLQTWIQRGAIALACLWLIVGVVLPLAELVRRAVEVELPVIFDDPPLTPAPAEDDGFRGEIRAAGYSILLLETEGRATLYVNRRPVTLADGRASVEDVEVRVERNRLREVIVRSVPAALDARRRRAIRNPLVIRHDATGGWRVDDEPLPPGSKVLIATRFIGIANFMDYFGLHGVTQRRLLFSLAMLPAAGGLIVRLLLRSRRKAAAFRGSLPARLLMAAGIALAAQALMAMARLKAGIGEDAAFAQSAWRSLAVAAATTGIAVPLGFVYAYGLARTGMRGKNLFRIVAMLPLFAPTMLFGLSLVYLFGNQGLVTTGVFGKLPWLARDIGLYGFTGIVISEAAYTFPAAVMILSVAMQHTDARLYEAATALGAGAWRTFFTVTLPGVKYGLLSAIFVCFTLSFTDFGAPKIVGGSYNVLAVDIYKQVVGQQNFGMGATVSLVLLAPTLAAFVADRIVQRRSHAALTARSVPWTPAPSPIRDAAFFAFCALIALAIFAALFTAGLASLITIWPYALSHPERFPSRWTLAHYTFQRVGGGGLRAFFTSLRMSAYTAVFGTIITFVSAWLIEKTRGAERLRQAAYLLSIVPLALPGLVIGIAYVFFFNKPAMRIPWTSWSFPNPFGGLYGTMAILVISNIIHFYTVSFFTATTALRQLDPEFERVSESMAVPFYKTFFRVSVPVCFPAIVEIAAYY